MTASSTLTFTATMDPIRSTSTNMVRRGAMPRRKGSGKYGPVRSLRLSLELDNWFEQRLRDDPRSASDILLEAVHGGLRLQPGYMSRQHRTLTDLAEANDRERY